MSRVTLIAANPRNAATGATQAINLAGGGSTVPYFVGGGHYRAGVASHLRFTSEFEYGRDGFTGGSIPKTGTISFRPAQQSLLDSLSLLYWTDADITVQSGEEGTALATTLVGTVAGVSIDDGALVITIADLSVRMNKPVCTARFLGTGGVEGGVEAKDRIKRRSWGRCFNVEGRVLDKTTNVYEFGALDYQWQAFDQVRDVGRAYTPITTIAWAGTVAATLTALKAAVVTAGGCAIAPSIACVKAWTQPKVITADIRGEVGSGYVETGPDIAARISTAVSGPTITNTAAMAALRPDACGVHIGSETETAAQAFDRALIGISLLWVLNPAGTITIRAFTFAAPVETLSAQFEKRVQVFAPIKTRRVGYQRNHRLQNDGEIAGVILAADANYADGTPVEALKPAQAGADVTAVQPIVARLNPTTGSALPSFIATDGRTFSKIAETGSARDGDVITFAGAMPAVPQIVFLPGGNTGTAGQNIKVIAEGLTTSGFTLSAKSQGVTPGTTVTDGSSSAGTGGEPARVINRTSASAPFDGAFRFGITATVGTIAGGEPGYINIGLFVKKSGAWIQVGSISRSTSGTFTTSVSPGVVDFGIGNEFGMTVMAAEGAGTAANFNSVSYTPGTVTETSLTPTGASNIPWLAYLQ